MHNRLVEGGDFLRLRKLTIISRDDVLDLVTERVPGRVFMPGIIPLRCLISSNNSPRHI